MFRTDAIKAILYVLITAGAMFMVMKQKLNQNIALIIIGVISLFDLWTVNKRYLNNDNFADKMFARNPFITEASESYLAKSMVILISKVSYNKLLLIRLWKAFLKQIKVITEFSIHYRTIQ